MRKTILVAVVVLTVVSGMRSKWMLFGVWNTTPVMAAAVSAVRIRNRWTMLEVWNNTPAPALLSADGMTLQRIPAHYAYHVLINQGPHTLVGKWQGGHTLAATVDMDKPDARWCLSSTDAEYARCTKWINGVFNFLYNL